MALIDISARLVIYLDFVLHAEWYTFWPYNRIPCDHLLSEHFPHHSLKAMCGQEQPTKQSLLCTVLQWSIPDSILISKYPNKSPRSHYEYLDEISLSSSPLWVPSSDIPLAH